MVPITFRFIIPLTWCHRRWSTSSWNLSTNMSWSSWTFWALPRYLSNSWWKIPSLPLNDLCYHRQHSCLPNTNLIMFCAIPWVPCYPAFVLLYLGILPSFMSRMSWEFHHLSKILDTSDTYHHHHSFLGPHVVSNRDTNKWTMMFGFCTSSNPIAFEVNGR